MNQNFVSLCFAVVSCGMALACSPDDPAVNTGDGEDESTESEDTADGVGTTDTTSSADTTGTTDTTDATDTDESADTEDTDEPDSTTESGSIPDMGTPGPDPNEQIPPPDEEGCHAIYAQDHLPTFELEIAEPVWTELMFLWNNGASIELEGGLPEAEFPLKEFRYGDVVIHTAEIRLRGNPTFWTPIPGDKMQFQIDFDKIDGTGHFLGLRKLVLDAATFNRHMLRDRLALAIMRDAGIAAPCANNARLVINGEYYGIFTNIEKLDEEFLERVFEDPTGDLWKRTNWQLKTNLDTATPQRLEKLKASDTVDELEDYLKLKQALRVFAAEAVLPNSDGMWAGGWNFYLYDDPTEGKFLMLPWDLDNTFERFVDPWDGLYPENPDPIVWEKPTSHGRPFYDLALTDPYWRNYYIEQIDDIVDDNYEPDELHDLIDEWTDQIEEAVMADENKPYSDNLYYAKVEALHDYIDSRHTFLVNWLYCWQNGGIPDIEGYCVLP